MCVFGLRDSFPSRQSVRALSGEAGRSVWLRCLIFFVLFLLFFFSLVRGNEMDFCCVTAACNVSAASSFFGTCCASLCDLFLCVSLYSNIPACFHVYILL